MAFSMKRKLALLFALIGWFAIVVQIILVTEMTISSPVDAIIRFFSYFTHLTNITVAIYLTCIAVLGNRPNKLINKPGTLTAVTTYITIVGGVYQIILRRTWHPEGYQLIVNEIFHSVVPVLTIIFWCLYETTKSVKYSEIFKWAIYPLIYLILILVRGSFSHFYPYDFINVIKIGTSKVLLNAVSLILVFLLVSALYLLIGKKVIKR